MTRTFVELPLFRSKWKALGLNDDDLKRLQEEILLDPKLGAVIQGIFQGNYCIYRGFGAIIHGKSTGPGYILRVPFWRFH